MEPIAFFSLCTYIRWNLHLEAIFKDPFVLMGSSSSPYLENERGRSFVKKENVSAASHKAYFCRVELNVKTYKEALEIDLA